MSLRGPGGPDSPGRVARRYGVPVSFVRDLIDTGALRAERDPDGWTRIPPDEQALLGPLADLRRIGLSVRQLQPVAAWLRSLPGPERGLAALRLCVARFGRSGWSWFINDAQVDGRPDSVMVLGLAPNPSWFGQR